MDVTLKLNNLYAQESTTAPETSCDSFLLHFQLPVTLDKKNLYSYELCSARVSKFFRSSFGKSTDSDSQRNNRTMVMRCDKDD